MSKSGTGAPYLVSKACGPLIAERVMDCSLASAAAVINPKFHAQANVPDCLGSFGARHTRLFLGC